MFINNTPVQGKIENSMCVYHVNILTCACMVIKHIISSIVKIVHYLHCVKNKPQNWFEGYFSNRNQYIEYNHIKSNTKK